MPTLRRPHHQEALFRQGESSSCLGVCQGDTENTEWRRDTHKTNLGEERHLGPKGG